MGVKNLATIAGRLEAGGLDPSTPAAIVQSATTAGHRRILGTLGTIAGLADAGRGPRNDHHRRGRGLLGPARLVRVLPPPGIRAMKFALIDNGSLEAAAHAGLRLAAREIGLRAGLPVEPVSWRHSDRAGGGTWTLRPWILAQVAAGEREFVFAPFFISPQGAIGSLLRKDLEALQPAAGGFEYSFSDGLPVETLAAVVAERAGVACRNLDRPAVVVVDHGGPSPASAGIRNRVADAVRARLGGGVGSVTAASMESPAGAGFGYNRPLLEEALERPGVAGGDVVISPLFLLPGRHAGAQGDLRRIARAAEGRSPGTRCHIAGLVGDHPLAFECLAAALTRSARVACLS